MAANRGFSRTIRWLRFLIGGAINTAFTYALYLAFNTLLNYQLAYMLAYALGIVFAYWFNAVFVFQVTLSWKGLLSYPLVYLGQYVASAVALGALVEIAGLDERLAPLLVVLLLAPMTYLISKAVLRWSSGGSAHTRG